MATDTSATAIPFCTHNFRIFLRHDACTYKLTLYGFVLKDRWEYYHHHTSAINIIIGKEQIAFLKSHSSAKHTDFTLLISAKLNRYNFVLFQKTILSFVHFKQFVRKNKLPAVMFSFVVRKNHSFLCSYYEELLFRSAQIKRPMLLSAMDILVTRARHYQLPMVLSCLAVHPGISMKF